jgi:hypothetical protein
MWLRGMLLLSPSIIITACLTGQVEGFWFQFALKSVWMLLDCLAHAHSYPSDHPPREWILSPSSGGTYSVQSGPPEDGDRIWCPKRYGSNKRQDDG